MAAQGFSLIDLQRKRSAPLASTRCVSPSDANRIDCWGSIAGVAFFQIDTFEVVVVGYSIEWEPPCGLIKRHFGHVTGREVLEANRMAERDIRFDSLRYAITDFSECTEVSVSPAEIEVIAAIDHASAATNPNIRLAIVATHPDVVAASTAYANDALAPFVARVFSSINAARSWLGLRTTNPTQA